jgi:hypothetical protein
MCGNESYKFSMAIFSDCNMSHVEVEFTFTFMVLKANITSLDLAFWKLCIILIWNTKILVSVASEKEED